MAATTKVTAMGIFDKKAFHASLKIKTGTIPSTAQIIAPRYHPDRNLRKIVIISKEHMNKEHSAMESI